MNRFLVVVFVVHAALISIADSFDNWTLRNPVVASTDINGIAVCSWR